MTLLLLLLACVTEVEDSGDPPAAVVTYEPVEGESCDAITMEVHGTDPPVVGDEWTVWLYCDDALLTGAMLLQLDPPELATVEDNVAVFLTEGEGILRMQVGSRRAEREVSVGPRAR